MSLNKQAAKRWSTYANLVSLIVAALMVGLPDLLPVDYHAYVALFGGLATAVCQFIRQGGLNDLVDES